MTEGPDLHGIPGGRARSSQGRVASQELVHEAEESVVAALLLDPSRTPDVLAIVQPEHFFDARLRPIIRAIHALCERGEPVDLVTVHAELDRAGTLEGAGGAAHLAEVFDAEATAANVLAHAKLVLRLSLERQLRFAHEEAAGGSRDSGVREQIAILHEQLDALDGGSSQLLALARSGDALRRLREFPDPVSPLPGFLPPEPGLVALVGETNAGKTRFALNLIQAATLGVPPWNGAPALGPARAGIISREQTIREIDVALRQLDTFTGRSRSAWTDAITIVAEGGIVEDGRYASALPGALRPLLVLNDEGLALLRRLLLEARDAGAPYFLMVLDSWQQLTPPDRSTSKPDEASPWLAELNRIAQESGTYLLLICHPGHDHRGGDPAHMARGTSSLAQISKAVWVLERRLEHPRHRFIRTLGNVDIGRRPGMAFRVCAEDAPDDWEVNRFELEDPASRASGEDPLVALNRYLPTPGGGLGEREIYRVVYRQVHQREHEGKGNPPGWRATAKLVSEWERRGWVEVIPGGEGQAKRIQRVIGVLEEDPR